MKAEVYYYCDWYYYCGGYEDGECVGGYWYLECDWYDDGEDPGGGGGGTGAGNPASVQITKASITDNEVTVVLSPSNFSGRLEIVATRDDDGTTVLSDEVRSASNPITVSFNNGGLPTGQYGAVTASWWPDSAGSLQVHGALPVQFRVLGTYHHSQYNTPYEGSCSGGHVDRDIAESGACSPKFGGSLKYTFANTTDTNGTGTSEYYGVIQTVINTNCENTGAHFFKKPTADGRWGRLYDDTVAKVNGHPFLSPHDHVFLVGYIGAYKEKEVTDVCGSCSSTQLDNYNTGAACGWRNFSHIGNLPTIRLR